MKVKVFTIRLTSEKMISDQKALNDFLETIKFVKSATHFVEAEDDSYWSVMVHFEDLYETKKKLRFTDIKSKLLFLVRLLYLLFTIFVNLLL